MSHESRSPPLQGRRILVVEDEWFIVTEIVEFLTDQGAVVVGPVSSLADGLDLATAPGPLDGAILNVSLHDEYSYPIADALRERGVPFAFATGIDRYAMPRAYASVPHISKPYEAAFVVKALFGRTEPQNSAV